MKLLRTLAVSAVGLLALVWATTNAQEGKGKQTKTTKDMGKGKTTSLADENVLGKVVDVQGITSIRPPLYDRWTPVCIDLPLKAGDWLRTDVRGANALRVRLSSKSSVVLGPGSVVELVDRGEIRASSGEFEVHAAEGHTLVVRGPGEEKQEVKDTKVFRVQKERLVELRQEPKWLRGFKAAIVNETLGSLVAKVDGRDVPLTVGDHKVRVDIRDQIARTTIEESFVNHTDATLEGVFYFPLPADASISGFGMWIGDQLIEADVVEKQRAREIYETILRERRDPGLLEWSGGNLFKARVFPIFPHSDKRIKITYTQVLPMRGSQYRYCYALQSEMLKQNPLRELKLDVHVHSSLPIKAVGSPTHSVRTMQASNSAQVEFSAQEYTPERDFEVVVDVDRQGHDLVFVPHQRGGDGYFMLLVNPPGDGQWQREVIKNSEPLDVIVLADTSGSMDQSLREAQSQFVAALLSSLGPKDTFRLAACDVDCQWAADMPQAATEKNINAARDFLAKRRSLGWTDLEAAFKSVIERAGAKTHVIYIGDGITTTGSAEPQEFANRLRQMYTGQGTFHAVAPGSTYERSVLTAIGSLGGGSVRRLAAGAGAGAPDSPVAVARDLLSEIAQPAIRDMAIEFHGLRAARVYPERLPNLPAGSQQIVLGRYLPDAASAEGEVVVTGTQNGKPVRLRTAVSLEEVAKQARRASELSQADEHSFIPRLWARMHLDSLLEQGQTQVIRDDIIALSEEYQIMTPYTSLLVLESDADRERFKVKRRFQMRDGEKFFAEGRSNVNFELAQQQMKRAGIWRANLQRRILSQLATLGRNVAAFRPQQPRRYPGMATRGLMDSGGFAGGLGGGELWDYEMNGTLPMSSAPAGGPLADLFDAAPEEFAREKDNLSETDQDAAEVALRGDDTIAENLPAEEPSQPFGAEDLSALVARDKKSESLYEDEALGQFGRRPYTQDLRKSLLSLAAKPERYSLLDGMNEPAASAGGLLGYGGRFNEWYGYHGAPGYYWFQSLVPTIPNAPTAEKPLPPSQAWPAEARAIAESLLRRDDLARVMGGIELNLETRGFDARRSTLAHRSFERLWVSSKAWLERHWSDNGQTQIHWADEKERGTIAQAFGIGRTRKSSPADLTAYGFDIGDHSLRSLERAYAGYKPELEKQADDRVVIKLTTPSNKDYETRIVVDMQRHVILRVSNFYRGKVTSNTTFSDFVQAAGTWWATRAETTDEKERTTSVIVLTVKEISAEAIKEQIGKELAGREQTVFFKQPLPSVRAAKQALAERNAGIDHRLIMALYFSHTQQWERVKEHVEALLTVAGERRGRQWLEMAALMMTRRNEELRQKFLAKAGELAKTAAEDKATNNEQFLAAHLIGQANQVLQGNELLQLLDSLKPLYEKLPEHLSGDKQWKIQRLTYLQQIGQQDAAFALIKDLAEKHREDQSLQQQYVNALTNRGEYEAAYARLDELLADAKLELTQSEADSYRSTYVQFLENEGRVDALAAYLEKWTALNPESSTPYQQYLSALQRNDQEKKVDDLIEKWLAEGREAVASAKDEAAPAPVRARLEAAVNYALGHVGPWWTYRIEEKWIEPLAQTVRVLVRHKDHQYAANSIMQHQNFRDTDQAKALRTELAELLVAEASTLPVERIGQIVGWIAHNDPIVELVTWKKIAVALEKRWASVKEVADRRQLAGTLVQIYGSHIGQSELLAFLERQVKEGPKEDKASHVQQLFDTLLAQPWKQEYEDRAYVLVKEIGEAPQADTDEIDAETKAARHFMALVSKLDALHRLNDRMVTARYEAAMASVEHQEKLTRTELAKKQKEARRDAQAAIADRLKRDREAFGEELAPWITVERTYLEVRLARPIDDALGEAWESVGAKPKDFELDVPLERLSALLHNRHLTTLAYLATRKEAKEELATRLLAYYEAGMKHASADNDSAKYWRAQKFELLVALDRPQELENVLRQWIDPKIADNTWKVALGYLLAEQAKFVDAIALFEEVEKADELGPVEYRSLADWYQVQNERDKHERASLAAYMALGERWLAGRLNRLANPWYHGGEKLPTELDPELLKVLTALFRKSEYPQNYIYHLQRLYQATRDFRLVATLADGAIGHSALKIYPIVEHMRSLLSDVRDEATVDQLAEYARKLRAQATTDVDRRALDLLEAVIERRAAELQNQPDPHVRASIAALGRANKGQWADGEQRLMADLLANLGAIAAKPLAEEQLRLLEALHAGVEGGSYDRLYIAHRLANTQWGYQKWDDAIRLIEAALAEFRAASIGVLPQSANDALAAYVNFLTSRGQHARGEQVYLAEIKTAPNVQQRHWLLQQLYVVYTASVSAEGRTSLGQGQTQYKAAEKRMLAELDTSDHNHRYHMSLQLCSLYRTANERKLGGVADDLRAFAFKRVPHVLKRQTNNYQSVVSYVASTVHDVAGARDGLAFLVERIEQEPRWLRYQNQDGWSQLSHYLAQWRSEVKDLGDLEPRLLTIVTDELRRDLSSRQSRNRQMYFKHNTYFWAEKEKAFALVAEEVLEKHMKSSGTIAYIAEYLWNGLGHRDRATAILVAAHERKVLDENAEAQLVNYLHEAKRFEQSIAILLPLVKRRPENLTYRVQLMHAYFQTQQQEKLLSLLAETDRYFHEMQRWQESNIAALAHSTLANALFEQSVSYFKEAIGLRERATPSRGVGDDTLSGYYMGLAQAHSGLKQTPEAVDAAGAAIVAWGPRHPRRAEALSALKNVLAQSPDLDAFAKKLDAQVAETGLENAIVRKSVGSVYLDRREAKKAIDQLKKAAEVQPNDAETHRLLVAAFDQSGDKQGAIDQLFASLELSRRNIELYKDLAQRFGAVGDARQAERAYLTIVEVLPTESESHAMLAAIREQQKRWSEAAAHWQRVAEIRQLEPTGLLKLASAQLQLKQWDKAQQTIRQLEKRDWPSRFSDVQQKIQELERQLSGHRS